MPGSSSSVPPGGAPRNVSFSKDSEESTAYQEHNPPAVLRKQEAARREMPAGPAEHASADSRVASPQILPQPHQQSHQPPHQQAHATAHALTHAHLGYSDENRSAAASVSSLVSGGSSATIPAHAGGSIFHPPGQSLTAATTAPPAAGNSDHPSKKDEVHILVAVTGSVATIKVSQIIHKLKDVYKKRAVIQLVVTKASTVFFSPRDLPPDLQVWYDKDEWHSRQAGAGVVESQTDQQLHIKLRRWADILLVAPCSANTLAKFTYGICDNLLTSIFRVWNPEVPILLAPAMNTHMYTNPVTKRHLQVMKESYPFVEILRPVEKVLVCGDIGMGGMREWQDIVQVLVKRVAVPPEEDDEEDDDDETREFDPDDEED